MRLADQLGGLARAAEMAGINRMQIFIAEQRGNLLSLPYTGAAKLAIRRSLAAPLQIPIGRAVANENYLHS